MMLNAVRLTVKLCAVVIAFIILQTYFDALWKFGKLPRSKYSAYSDISGKHCNWLVIYKCTFSLV